jgi:hypothetical protein
MDEKPPAEGKRDAARILPFRAKKNAAVAAAEEVDPDLVVKRNHAYYRSGRDQPPTIEFKLGEANPCCFGRLALNPSLLTCGAWISDASGFTLEYENLFRITVTGRGLQGIYDLILQKRLLWIQEEGRDAIADPNAPRIYAIHVEHVTETSEA